MVYFGVGLLPDPDGPFTPGIPNFHTWLVAIVFEILIVIVSNNSASSRKDIYITIGSGALRILLLLSMVTLFIIRQRKVRRYVSGTDSERQYLVEDSAFSRNYGVSAMQEKLAGQPVGWINYFYGFSKLFPYIW